MRLAYLIACDGFVEDPATKKFNFIGAFDKVGVYTDAQDPKRAMFIGGRILDVSAGKVQFDIFVKAEDGTPVGRAQIPEGNLEVGGHVNVAASIEVKLPTEGKYFLHASFNGKELSDENQFFFEVLKIQRPEK